MTNKTKRTGLMALVVMGFLLAGVRSEAASWIVWPGQSLQAAITNASAGDNITLKEGNYIENITLAKGLDIRGEAGKENTTTVQGTWTIQNAAAPIYLKGFKVGVSRDGSMTINNCTDVRMDYVNITIGNVSAVNSKVYMLHGTVAGTASYNACNWTQQRSSCGWIMSTNSDTKLLACTIVSNVVHGSSSKDCTVFQSTIGEQLYVDAANYWVAYNRLRNLEVRDGTGTCEVVGNVIDVRGGSANAVRVVNTSPVIRNNRIRNAYFQDLVNIGNSNPVASDMCNGVYVVSGAPLIVDNVIADLRVYVNNSSTFNGPNWDYYVTRSANGIYVANGNAARVLGNIIQNVSASSDGAATFSTNTVYADASVQVQYCDLRGAYNGGCFPTNCLNVDPLFAETTNYVLQVGSPVRDLGVPDADYNDLDGSRNDMGCWGGHAYDPNGMTTTNPVVMSTSASPLYVKRGQNIMLKARGAVAAP